MGVASGTILPIVALDVVFLVGYVVSVRYPPLL